jgi:epoxyqueuosine reductase
MGQKKAIRKDTKGPLLKGEAMDLGIMSDIDFQLRTYQPAKSINYKARMAVEQFTSLDGPVADKRVVMGPEEATRTVREKALGLGADLVGFTELDPRFVVRDRPVGGRWAVSIAYAMDFDEIGTAPEERSGIEVTKAYYVLGAIVVKLAELIRALGYSAYAHHPRAFDGTIGSVLHKPIAQRAGLGEIGRNTLLLTPEFGPRVRLATVSTELEFVPTSPISIGLAEYCDRCKKCYKKCPTGAIPENRTEVSMTGDPGGERTRTWRLDYAKCLPFFVRTDGCAVCVKECTFNQPVERAEAFAEKALGKKVRPRKGQP